MSQDFNAKTLGTEGKRKTADILGIEKAIKPFTTKGTEISVLPEGKIRTAGDEQSGPSGLSRTLIGRRFRSFVQN